MLNIPTTHEEFFKAAVELYKKFPQSPEDVKDLSEKVQKVFKTEYENTQAMVTTYQKASVNAATDKEIATANKQVVELAKGAAFLGLVCIPGAVFMLPTILESAREYDIDLVPKSVSEQFGI